MKNKITMVIGVLVLLNGSIAEATVISGPVTFGTSNYYLLSKNSWTGAEGEAVSLGGNLVTVDSAAENTFLVNTFVLGGHTGDPLWIGFTDRAVKGSFVWASGQPVTFTNWAAGEPNDAGGNEDYAALNWHFAYGSTTDHGVWNDTPVNGSVGYGGTTDGPYYGIAEVAVPEPGCLMLVLIATLGAAGRNRYRLRYPSIPSRIFSSLKPHFAVAECSGILAPPKFL